MPAILYVVLYCKITYLNLNCPHIFLVHIINIIIIFLCENHMRPGILPTKYVIITLLFERLNKIKYVCYLDNIECTNSAINISE